MGQCNSTFFRNRNRNRNRNINKDKNVDFDLINSSIGEYYSFSGRRVNAKIVQVYDGDTCTAIFRLNDSMESPLIQYKIRLAGIDTPELRPSLSIQDRDLIIEKAKEAKKVVEEKILNKLVFLQCNEFDKYGRILATIITSEGLNLNQWLLDNGYAVNYKC